MNSDEAIVGSRVIDASEYEAYVRSPADGEIVSSYVAYRIVLDRGVLEVDSPISMLIDGDGRKANVLDLLGYTVEFMGHSEGEEQFQITFENGFKILADYYYEGYSLVGPICFTLGISA